MITEVPYSPDLARILGLPLREWEPEQAIALARWLTDQLRNGQGCDRCGGMREHSPACTYPAHEAPPLALRPVQAIMLWEFYQNWGGYGQIPVGVGKSLIMFLAAYVISSLRPLHFVPAALVRDTYAKFELYSRYWVNPRPMPAIESYQQLTQVGSVDLLARRMPDHIGGDECDKWRHLTRSGAKRVGFYVDAARDQCACLFLSGTSKRKSIRDDAHFAVWALRDRAPTFLYPKEMDDACLALDEESIVGAGRLRPGALRLLAEQAGIFPEQPEAPSIGELARIREGYSLRFRRTPGIVVWDASECDQPLTIDFELPPHDQEIENRFEYFRSTWLTPDEYQISEPLSYRRHCEELGCGFYYRWDPRAPKEWLAARKAWGCFVRNEIERTARDPKGLHTEMAVARAFPDHPYLLDWQLIRPTFEPNSVPTWLAGSVIYKAAQRIEEWKRSGTRGLVWCRQNAVALAVASVTGIPYYGAKGERIDQYARPCPGETIERDKPPIAILGFASNHRGRNLQAYDTNYMIGWEQAATAVEQFIGRTHRSGQSRPVRVTVLVTCGETLDAFDSTLSEARFVKTQGLTQKILTARIDRSGLRAYPEGFRWVRRE